MCPVLAGQLTWRADMCHGGRVACVNLAVFPRTAGSPPQNGEVLPSSHVLLRGPWSRRKGNHVDAERDVVVAELGPSKRMLRRGGSAQPGKGLPSQTSFGTWNDMFPQEVEIGVRIPVGVQETWFNS